MCIMAKLCGTRFSSGTGLSTGTGFSLCAAALLLLPSLAFALNPSLDVSQYAHQSWKVRDGFTKGAILDVAQTSDGYLWLATEFGLLRFDGVNKPVPWPPLSDQSLPSSNVRKLLAARDGTLWIGTFTGLASWKNGRLTRYPEVPESSIIALLEDSEGTICVSTNFPKRDLCEIHEGSVQCHSEADASGQGVYGLHQDRKGNLWVGTGAGVWRWNPGPPQFYSLPELDGIQGMADGDDGSLLISTTGGVRQFADGKIPDGKIKVAYPYPASMRETRANQLFRDRDGGLWIGTGGRGIIHIHQGRTDIFSQSDGLTGDRASRFFEDREGNIWVATVNGLDHFRELPIVSLTVKQGLSNAPSGPVLVGRDGSIWFNTSDGLDRLNNGRITVYGHGKRPEAGIREISDSGLPDNPGALFVDSRGRVWVSSPSGVGYLENDRYISSVAPGGGIYALTEDVSGNLWIANQERGLFRLSSANEAQQIPWDTFGRGTALTLAADPSKGGVWIGFANGGIAWYRDGKVQASYSDADGLGKGSVYDLRFEEGVLWAATQGGLSLLKNGHPDTITSKNGLPCDAVHWTMEDDAQSV
jgi:ligand-binding sensor domain-containing protein